ncbi:hypothetical protein ALI44B_01000 [Leifsonia sp. ALI-44-B]|uniref:MinD/ParA family ATP-binding protein n=1 Tax=Leifsonia sp. ALI-44-B TaxID=1933776 RepID=UPI00097C6065|nr:hypothetical protein [Leifsonia sp. ALI-44-B]ONI65303.1 hypothetical protein ALI44B_01000 [Leifsonia sp. ALI-44-B]
MIIVTINQDGTGSVALPGEMVPIARSSADEARTSAVEVLTKYAAYTGRNVEVETREGDQLQYLRVYSDGRVEPIDAPNPLAAHAAPATAPVQAPDTTPTKLPPVPPLPQQPAQRIEFPPAMPAPSTAYTPQPQLQPSTSTPPQSYPPIDETTQIRPTAAQRQSAQPAGDAPQTRREARGSFLTDQTPAEEPATQGWRGFATRLGIRLAPSDQERNERHDVHAVSQHWPGPRTIAIVNAKGGANETPTTVLLSSVFARFGGAGVLAWDNNHTRGTLGWRTEQGPHEQTLHELLPDANRLLGPDAQAADLARYVHHQTRDQFDVLRGKPTVLQQGERIGPGDVDQIHAVATKFYRLVIIDSGNDETDPVWLRMIDKADHLVLASTTGEDRAEVGALLLEKLAERDERTRQLANNSVVIISEANDKAPGEKAQKIADGFRSLTRETVTIPYDPAMVQGLLRYGSLKPATQRAWLSAAAAVARGL